MKNHPLPCLTLLFAALVPIACGNDAALQDNDTPDKSAESLVHGSENYVTKASTDAATVMATVGDANSTQCPGGGKLLAYGADTNGNGSLDAAEITRAYPVCNGGVGATGLNGNNGFAGSNGANGVPGHDVMATINGNALIVADAHGVPVPVLPYVGVGASGNFVDANNVLWGYAKNANGAWAPTGTTPLVSYADSNCLGPIYVTVFDDNVAMAINANFYTATSSTHYQPNGVNPGYVLSGNTCHTGFGGGPYVVLTDLVHLPPATLPGTPPYHFTGLQH